MTIAPTTAPRAGRPDLGAPSLGPASVTGRRATSNGGRGDAPSAFDRGLSFEDALFLFILEMAEDAEREALAATEELRRQVPANAGAEGEGASDSQEAIAMRVRHHLERKGNLLLLANSIAERQNQTLDRLIQSIAQP